MTYRRSAPSTPPEAPRPRRSPPPAVPSVVAAPAVESNDIKTAEPADVKTDKVPENLEEVSETVIETNLVEETPAPVEEPVEKPAGKTTKRKG